VTLAVLGETKAKGPVADWALGIVVLLDVVVLPVFAIALSVAKGQLLGDPFEASALLTLGHELFASMAAGVTFGLVVAGLLRVITSERVLMVCAIAYGVTALCQYLHYDTLLVFVVAGFLVTNLTKQGPPLIETSDKTSAAVMVVFFATAGAKLDLEALLKLWPVAIALFAARIVFALVSAKIGHAIAKDPPVVRKNAWLGLVSQAGVTIGFATIAGDALPVIGPPLASLAIAVVGLNELVGAALFKWSLVRAGEVPKSASGEAATGAAAPGGTHAPSPPT
jgi:Kef-type K+ transport system membrane component KefB